MSVAVAVVDAVDGVLLLFAKYGFWDGIVGREEEDDDDDDDVANWAKTAL